MGLGIGWSQVDARGISIAPNVRLAEAKAFTCLRRPRESGNLQSLRRIPPYLRNTLQQKIGMRDIEVCGHNQTWERSVFINSPTSSLFAIGRMRRDIRYAQLVLARRQWARSEPCDLFCSAYFYNKGWAFDHREVRPRLGALGGTVARGSGRKFTYKCTGTV